MIRAIRWLALELEGFGVWRDPIEFGFPERLGVLALPNERGKSTLVSGLAAILYGLPADVLPHMRSWGSDGPCRGRLDLALDGRLIRIRRDIASHKTVVEEIEDGRTREILFNDTANPAGRTSSRHGYAEVLRGILGDLADEALFRATFLVTQPVVPVGEVTKALPRLIGGVGRVSGEEARDLLFDEVKRLTRATGDLLISATGKTPTNQRKEGAIETAEARIRNLERLRDDTSLEFARIGAQEDALRDAEGALARAAEEERHARADADRLAAFRKEAASFEETVKGRDELAEALRRHDEELAFAREIEQGVARDFPDLAGASPSIEGAIDEAISLESRLESARPDLERLEHELDGKRVILADLHRWDTLPGRPDPVAWITRVRATAERWCEVVRRWEEIAQERRAAEEEWPRFAAVAGLPEEMQDSLARLPEALAELGDRERILARGEEGRRLLAEGMARRREGFGRCWAALQGVEPAAILATLESRVVRHRKLREIEAEVGEIRSGSTVASSGRRWKRGVVIGIPAALIAAAIPLALRSPPAIAAAMGIVVLALAVFLLSSPSRGARDANRRLAELEIESDRIRASLRMEFLPSGPWLPDDADSYDRARAAFAERDEDEALMRREEENLASGHAEEDAARLQEKAREQRERLQEIAREVEEAVSMPAVEAVRACRGARRRFDQIEERLAATRAEMLGVAEAPAGADDPLAMPIDHLGPTWHPLVEAGKILDLGATSLGELRAKLGGLTRKEWDEWESLARHHAEAQISLAGGEAERRERLAKIHEMEEGLAEAIVKIGPERVTASGGSLTALRARFRMRAEAAPRSAAAARVAGECLKTARGGPYADRDALAAALASMEDRRRDTQHRMDVGCEESDLVRAYHQSSGDPAAQDRIRRQVESRMEGASRHLDDAKGAVAQARANLDAWRPPAPANLAAIEIEIARLRETTKVLLRRRDATLQAWRILGEAVDEFRSTHRVELADKIDARFQAITRHQGRRITLDSDLGIEVIEDGASVSEERLSQGARDQLAFSLRIAVAELIGGEILLPLILDDPFVHSDAERLARIRAALDVAARDRQVILLTQDDRLREWGDPVSTSPHSR